MYRMIIEHPKWITADRLARINRPRRGHMGRIYRVVPEDRPARPIAESRARRRRPNLVAALDSPGGWQRDWCNSCSSQRGDKSVIPALVRRWRARMHAAGERACRRCARSMDSKGSTPAILAKALHDKHPGVRRNAVRLCEASAQIRRRSWAERIAVTGRRCRSAGSPAGRLHAGRVGRSGVRRCDRPNCPGQSAGTVYFCGRDELGHAKGNLGAGRRDGGAFDPREQRRRPSCIAT